MRVHPDDIDPQALERLLTAWLSSDYSRLKAEWAYRQVPRRILVEELLEVDGSPPPDFKFWCIEGKVRFLQVDADRFGEHTRSIHAPNGEPLDAMMRYPKPSSPPQLPKTLPIMRDIAERLASGLEFIRVDLYAVGERIIVGELTNYPGGGFERMSPQRLLNRLGDDWRPGRRRG